MILLGDLMLRMKKTCVLSVAFIMVLTLFSGCADPTGSLNNSDSEASGAQDNEGYSFKTSGIAISMHDDMAPILDKLGEAKSYFEAESCAFPGLEKTYTYSSFSLYTYEDGDIDRLAALVILDDSVGTAEGIYLNDSLDKIIAAYGSDYTHSLNLYSFEKDRMKLSFIVEDDIVTSIEYVALAGE